jgi:tyrosyl-tRNA synthetase
MKIYTFLPLDEIESYSKLEGEELNSVKEILAYEATMIVHGKENADKARETALNIFRNGSLDAAPSIQMDEESVIGKELAELCLDAKIFDSKSEARRMISQGGLSLNGNKITDIKTIVQSSDVNEGAISIKKGKKSFYKIEIIPRG